MPGGYPGPPTSPPHPLNATANGCIAKTVILQYKGKCSTK